MASPLISADGSLGMVYLESAKGKPRYNVADLDTLVFICNYLAMAIDRLLRVQSDQLDKMRSLDQEMSRKVQLRTAPWQLPQWPELQLAVLTEPGAAVCTDFYDVLPLGDKQAMILVGQTPAGKADTAISIAEMSSAFRIGAVHRDLPQVLLRQINWLMFSTTQEARHLSAGVVSIDAQSGEFCICLAGNVYAYLIGSTGKAVQIKTEGNPLVGEARKSKYEAVQGKLNPDQMLAVCTGGVFSIASPDNRTFGEQHLLDFLSDNCDQVPARILSDLAEDINSFTGGKKTPNDITLLLLRKNKAVG
jgi:sigma-B regulation protein RsbU (phosphoserine phosphatase)